MTIKETIIQVLSENNKAMKPSDICDYAIKKEMYYGESKTPLTTFHALCGEYSKNGILFREKNDNNEWVYYIPNTFDNIENKTKTFPKSDYRELDLHYLLSVFLSEFIGGKNILNKTINHNSSNKKDKDNNWIHPDMVGVDFLDFKEGSSKQLLKHIDVKSSFNLYSFEIKKQITNDSELKEYFFQAVSNSSWANYGYLVAMNITDNVRIELYRLSEAYGIGVILLKGTAWSSQVLSPAKYKDLDFKVIDKLSSVNKDFKSFIESVNNIIDSTLDKENTFKKELISICDDSEWDTDKVEDYCKKKNIPFDLEIEY